MDGGTIFVQMLGEFSITLNEKTITDSANRSKKVWLLLAYMIYCRSHSITPSDLINLERRRKQYKPTQCSENRISPGPLHTGSAGQLRRTQPDSAQGRLLHLESNGTGAFGH